MLTKILGESQRRRAIINCLEKIIYPVDRQILKINWFKQTELCMSVGEFQVFFRPFLFSDLIILFTDYEPYIKRIFQPNKGETVVDVGAHIGVYTLNAANKVGDSGIVVSFEPDKRNLKLLNKNIKINGFRKVKTINAALDRCSSEKTLYLTNDPLFSSMTPSVHAKEKIAIETVTLDSMAETLNLTHIDWIKIDVEGNELNVLEGGQQTFSNCVDRVIIETSNPKALHFLSERGFTIQKLFGINYFAYKIR
jgi:FkbM family methyltransferase